MVRVRDDTVGVDGTKGLTLRLLIVADTFGTPVRADLVDGQFIVPSDSLVRTFGFADSAIDADVS